MDEQTAREIVKRLRDGNGLQTADEQLRYGLSIGVVWFAASFILVFARLVDPIILLTNLMAIFLIGVILLNGLGHWRKFWRVWNPKYVVALPSHSIEEVQQWVADVVDPMNYQQHNQSHVYSFRHSRDAVAFKLV